MSAARALGGVLLAVCAASPVRSAEACGIGMSFHSQGHYVRGEVPYLAIENVLLIWDRDKRMQHFVREVRFGGATASFSFIVPTPTVPEVAKVEGSPFGTLSTGLPFESAWVGIGDLGSLGHGAGTGTGMGYGGGGGVGGGQAIPEPPPPVQVLGEARVGAFTAYTLGARDLGTLQKWLVEHRIDVTPELGKWLGHYVNIGFAFVALRYDAPSEQEAHVDIKSQVVRISFPTPVPYYPYLEPVVTRKHAPPFRRMNLWYASQEGGVPVARELPRTGPSQFVQPLRAGERYKPTRKLLAEAVGKELEPLLPAATDIVVQTFQDRKTRRDGFGDALFVPETAKPLTAADLDERRGLFAALDVDLAPAAPTPTFASVAPSASASANPSVAPSASASSSVSPSASAVASAQPATAPTTPKASGSCALGPPGSSVAGLGFALALGALLSRRRSRVPLAVGLLAAGTWLACKRESAPAPAVVASVTASVASIAAAPPSVVSAGASTSAPAPLASLAPTLTKTEQEAHEAMIARLLDGSQPGNKLPVHAQDPGTDWDPVVYVPKKVQPVVKMLETGVKVTGKLPPEVVRRIVRANFPRLRFCYQQGLNADPGLKGTVLLTWTISTEGVPVGAALDGGGGTISAAKVKACAVGVVKTLAFPEPESGTVEVHYGIDFKME